MVGGKPPCAVLQASLVDLIGPAIAGVLEMIQHIDRLASKTIAIQEVVDLLGQRPEVMRR